MTLVTSDPAPAPVWTLSDVARDHLKARGISLSQVYRVLRIPELTTPSPEEGITKYFGYGLVVAVNDESVIQMIGHDGATADNWQDWAIERALFADGDVAGADALVRAELRTLPPPRIQFEQPKPKKHDETPPPVTTTHVLDSIHPALRDEITRQVAGDFSRLEVHSPTRVTIHPPG